MTPSPQAAKRPQLTKERIQTIKQNLGGGYWISETMYIAEGETMCDMALRALELETQQARHPQGATAMNRPTRQEIERLLTILASFEWDEPDYAFVHTFTEGPRYTNLEHLANMALESLQQAGSREARLEEALEKIFVEASIDRLDPPMKAEDYFLKIEAMGKTADAALSTPSAPRTPMGSREARLEDEINNARYEGALWAASSLEEDSKQLESFPAFEEEFAHKIAGELRLRDQALTPSAPEGGE